MPETIFEWASLGLLAIAVVLLVAIYQTLTALRRDMESRPAGAPSQQRETGVYEGGYQPAAAASAATPAPAVGDSQFHPRPEAEAHPLDSTRETPTTTAPQPAVAAAPATAEEPQDQPFERDGRWWFRRGDELLVYDEQAGQWVPAPADATGGAPGLAGAPAEAPESTLTHPSFSGEGSAFWKCPSCGAVNGSTAATCRMCFTPRA
jgi:hypothetical protein